MGAGQRSSPSPDATGTRELPFNHRPREVSRIGLGLDDQSSRWEAGFAAATAS
jgi:hypothetical protein